MCLLKCAQTWTTCAWHPRKQLQKTTVCTALRRVILFGRPPIFPLPRDSRGAERGKRLLLRFVFYPSDVKREEKKAWRKKRACVLREREVGERRELLLLSSSSSYHETRATGAGVVCRSALACAELRHSSARRPTRARGGSRARGKVQLYVITHYPSPPTLCPKPSKTSHPIPNLPAQPEPPTSFSSTTYILFPTPPQS